MKNYKKHIDDFFREKLGKYRETPPADVWDDLSLRLTTLKPYVPGSPYKWLWHVGMVSVIAVFTVSLVKKLSKPAKEAQQTVAENIAPVQTEAAKAIETDVTDATAFNEVALPSTMHAEESESSNNDAEALNNNTTQPHEEYTPSSGGGSKAGNKPAARNTAVSAAASSPVASAANAVVAGEEADNIYNAGMPEPQHVVADTREIMSEPVAKVNAPAKKEEQIAKKAEPVVKQKELENKKKHSGLAFGFGVKAGYERGFSDAAATKYLVSPYVQLKLSPKVSILVQPAIKYAQLSNKTLNTESYYKVTDAHTGVDVKALPVTGSQVTYQSTYTYTAGYDSIVNVRSFGGSYTEFELPLMLQYKVAPKVAVYGGVNVALTKMSGIKEQTYTTHKVRTADSVINNPVEPYSGPAPDLSYKVQYSVAPYSDYTSPSYVNKQETSVRLGYMLGFTYEYSRKWLFDALVQQSPVKPDLKEGYNVKAPLSSPYFRLSVGYKLK